MTNFLLLIIIGYLANAFTWYWVLMSFGTVIELVKAMCKFFQVVSKEGK